MKATEILFNEHRVIEQVLDCLQAIAAHAQSTGRLDAAAARNAVAFFRNFADRCHHGKEEVHLFPALEAQGFPRDGGPTGVMLHEHDQGRMHVRGMDESIAASEQGDAQAIDDFLGHAQSYIALLREHIHKEDHILFPLADRTLGEAEQQALLAAFQRVETEEMDAGAHERFLRIAAELAEQFGTAAVACEGQLPCHGGRGGFRCC